MLCAIRTVQFDTLLVEYSGVDTKLSTSDLSTNLMLGKICTNCSSSSSSSLSSTTEDCGPSIVVPVVLYRFDSCVTWSNSKFENRSQWSSPLRGIKPPLENEFR
uniref:Uncharacterized protein n=1 Tax=Cacopsylla melanoneura TaxID=428564 RepID=A0A8D8YP42_9HEMI